MNRSKFGSLAVCVSASVLLLAASCLDDKPSPEFTAAKVRLEQVITETFDDSFRDPKFAEVQKAFEAIPKTDKNYKRAQEYVNKISSAQGIQSEVSEKKSTPEQKRDSQIKEENPNKENHPHVKETDDKSAQRKAYDKAINDFKKAEKMRGEKLKAVMNEINTLAK